MSAPKLFCPQCGFNNPPNSYTCTRCGSWLAATPGEIGADSLLNIRNPHHAGLIALIGPIALFFLPTLLALGLIVSGNWDNLLIIPAMIGAGLFAIFCLTWLVSWLLGRRQITQIRAFLNSDRPVLRWSYTPEEWRQLKEVTWQEEKSDWQLQLGCLTAIFGLVGLLVGAMIGFEEGLTELFLNGFGGAGIGVMVGIAIGMAVASSNYVASRWSYHRVEPGLVALAPHEIYANDVYFHGDGDSAYIQQATLTQDNPPQLLIELRVPPKPRAPLDEEWYITVPPRLVAAVEAILPRLTAGRR